MCSMDAHAVVFSNTLCVACTLYACRFCSVFETKLGTQPLPETTWCLCAYLSLAISSIHTTCGIAVALIVSC
jgi:hypothetical protein